MPSLWNKASKCYFLVVFLLSFLLSCSRVSLTPGASAPEFSLPSLSGDLQGLKTFQGKTILLNFWSSWCVPCMQEASEFEKLYRELKNQDFIIIGIAVDDTLEAVQKFKNKFGLSFPLLLDSEGKVKKKYKINGYPETFLIDKSGKFRFINDNESGSPEIKIKGPRNWNSNFFKSQFS